MDKVTFSCSFVTIMWLARCAATLQPKDSNTRTTSCPVRVGMAAITPQPQPAESRSSTVSPFPRELRYKGQWRPWCFPMLLLYFLLDLHTRGLLDTQQSKHHL